MAHSIPSGTVTFLFTDIESSTKKWERHPAAMRGALARHDEILRGAIECNSGYVFKTVGDAFCAAFWTAPNAVTAIIKAQTELHAEDWGETGELKVRASLHTGAADERDGDYYGIPVNRVARLLSAGHGGQTLLSLPAYELVRDFLPEGAALAELGEYRLKDLARPERIFQLTITGVESDFAPLETLDSLPNNLPVQPTPFIGREREVRKIRNLLGRSEVRLLTLTGPGGTGKTRLGLQLAADVIDEYADGVYHVGLDSISNHNLLINTISHALGLRESSDQPIEETLKSFLREKQMLLFLDNFEQIITAASKVGELLVDCSMLTILVTSREVLQFRPSRNDLSGDLPPAPCS